VFLVNSDDVSETFTSSGKVFESIAWPMAVVIGYLNEALLKEK